MDPNLIATSPAGVVWPDRHHQCVGDQLGRHGGAQLHHLKLELPREFPPLDSQPLRQKHLTPVFSNPGTSQAAHKHLPITEAHDVLKSRYLMWLITILVCYSWQF